MQMVEPVALPNIVLDETSPCWFCEKKGEESNVEQGKRGSSLRSGTARRRRRRNSGHNDSSALGQEPQKSSEMEHHGSTDLNPIDLVRKPKSIRPRTLLAGNASPRSEGVGASHYSGRHQPKGSKARIAEDINSAENAPAAGNI